MKIDAHDNGGPRCKHYYVVLCVYEINSYMDAKCVVVEMSTTGLKVNVPYKQGLQ